MLVGVELRPQFDVGMDSFRGGLQVSFFHRSKERASATFPHSKHGSFTNRPASGAEFLVLMLVCFLATDKTLVKLYHAFQFLHDGGSRARLTQAVENKPCRLLRNADLLRQLQARDSLAGGHEQIHGVKPLVQRNLATLENGSGSHSEVEIPTRVAAVEADPLTGCNPLIALAVWTGHAVRPEARFQVEPSGFLIREGLKELESADGAFAHLAHLLLLLRGVATLIEDRSVLFFRETVRVAFLALDRILNADVLLMLAEFGNADVLVLQAVTQNLFCSLLAAFFVSLTEWVGRSGKSVWFGVQVAGHRVVAVLVNRHHESLFAVLFFVIFHDILHARNIT